MLDASFIVRDVPLSDDKNLAKRDNKLLTVQKNLQTKIPNYLVPERRRRFATCGAMAAGALSVFIKSFSRSFL